MMNNFNKTSKLNIVTKVNETTNKNYLSDISFTAPFKVTKPFYDEFDNMSIMLMSVSAGIMEGDIQDISITVEDKSKVKIFSQAYEKIHKMKEGKACRKTEIEIGRNSFLEYSPLPTIPFGESSFENETVIKLIDKSSKLAYSEILTSGRVGRGEKFEYKCYKSRTSVSIGDELIYHDNANYIPNDMKMEGYCMFEGYTHQSNLLLFNFCASSKEQLAKINGIINNEPSIIGGSSVSHTGDICVKLLGNTSENLIRVNTQVIEMLRDTD